MTVFVLSVCPVDWYGDHCSHRCGANCKDCNKSNGICDFGCYAGWQGGFCEKGKKKFVEAKTLKLLFSQLLDQILFKSNAKKKCNNLMKT